MSIISEELYFLGYNAICCGSNQQTFQMNISLQYSDLKKQARRIYQADGGDMFVQNVGWNLADCTELYART
jgi:hypothetical protein